MDTGTKETQTARILKLLRQKNSNGDYMWVSFRSLNNICFRYGARLWELKHQDGYEIEKRSRRGVWEYRLVHDAAEEAMELAD